MLRYKRIILGEICTACILLLTACSSGVAANKIGSHRTSEQAKAQVTYYEDLSTLDKHALNFIFKIEQDETKDNTADPVYAVSLKVKNNTNKTVKFDKSKFIYFASDRKILSKKKGTLTLKPHTSSSEHQLFESVAEQETVGGGAIAYLNQDNLLSYDSFINGIATSTNLKSSQLAKQFKARKDNAEESTSSNTQDSTVNSTTAANASNSEAAQQSSAGLTREEAINTLQEWAKNNGAEAFEIDALQIGQGDNGSWSFTDSNGQSWTVSPTGKVHAPGDPIE
ncbi:hypothetical protein [Liquorilactobacillus satsumensis]|nr:hypothetical protein [Liquorilactobacillus satsumensis]MCC7667214.1 hypothetical protein [Liquorilactobacillus satsumensis]MCP9328101.1 hypothetical protein [Liquorilactobacillus satsumensis]